ncbi:MAG: cyclopropane-fatty-acyl-phospholipid synthase family protein [Alphaproteobacteria bacterium]|nr:cyclopropane-fatty-acyl-phospholipid synthase family protein [Alphaproteobacteria bacterium]
MPYLVRLLLPVAARLQWGSVTVKLPDGRKLEISGSTPGKHAELHIKNYACLWRLVRMGNLGFAEGYLAHEWDTPNLTSLLEVFARNADCMSELYDGKWWAKMASRLAHIFNRNTRAGSRRNIHAHYDLGNAFYQRWLDASMTYSSAKFETPGETLAAAQLNKYRSLAARIDLRPEHRLLEIGCGWGGFAEFAAKEIGCHVTGITISREQHDFARRRLSKAGLADRTDIRLEDYRDTQGTFDRIASIEMFEAVGEEYWPAYFRKLETSLAPGGRAGLQIITIDERYFEDYRSNVDFIQKYVFPGGMLPSMQALRNQVAVAGLSWTGNTTFGLDYARTLESWRERFLGAWDDIRLLGFDEKFKRLWGYYLSYCEAGFRAGSIDVTQVALAKR